MRAVTILLLATLTALFIGCGGGSSGSSESNEGSSSSTAKETTLLYDYNKDGASRLLLPAQSVNQYLDVQTKLKKTRDNKSEFDSILAGFIGSLFIDSDAIGSVPSYAPEGEMKSKIVRVTNASIDYSDYLLQADINLDNAVDQDDLDLLSTALFKDDKSSEYDVNGDGKVNTADVVYLSARFGSVIASYDFYTSDGVKLDIPTRSVDDPRSFTYKGSETEVMVVAKDGNGASSFETGLSDIDEVWYKQTGWKLQSSEPFSLRKTPKRLLRSGIEGWSFLDGRNNVYLLGWNYSMEYSGNRFLPKELTHPLTHEIFFGTIESIKDEINLHFDKTDMKHPAQETLTEHDFKYKIGAMVDKENHYAHGYVTSNIYALNGKTITVREMYWIDESLYYSLADKTLVGTLESSSQRDIKGTVIAERIGPDPKEQEFPVETVDDDSFAFFDAPLGTYDLNYLDECLCVQALDENYVFENEDAEPNFKIDSKKVTVTLELVDRDNNPISDKSISLLAKDCVSSDDDEKSFDATTDSNGKVIVDNVPIGDYTVFVDDKDNSEINVCDTYNGTLYLDKLWDIDINFTGRFCTYNKSVKKVKIAGVNDSLKSWSDKYPYPQPLSSDGKLLVDTSFYTNEEDGILLEYYPNGNSGYYQGLSVNPEAIRQKCMDTGDTWFGDPDYAPSWDGVDTMLHSTQTNAFYAHKAFQIHDTGDWVNAGGSSTLTITFTPSN